MFFLSVSLCWLCLYYVCILGIQRVWIMCAPRTPNKKSVIRTSSEYCIKMLHCLQAFEGVVMQFGPCRLWMMSCVAVLVDVFRTVSPARPILTSLPNLSFP